jgi:hypothetical protein
MNINCVLIFLYILSEIFLVLRKVERDMIINIYIHIYVRFHVKYSFFLSDLNETWIFSTGVRKTPKHKNFENLSNERLVVPCGRKDERAETDT